MDVLIYPLFTEICLFGFFYLFGCVWSRDEDERLLFDLLCQERPDLYKQRYQLKWRSKVARGELGRFLGSKDGDDNEIIRRAKANSRRARAFTRISLVGLLVSLALSIKVLVQYS